MKRGKEIAAFTALTAIDGRFHPLWAKGKERASMPAGRACRAH